MFLYIPKMLHKKDLLILAELRRNARSSLTKMSKMTLIPISTIFDKLRLYEESLIMKHTSLIDFSGLGFHSRIIIIIKTDRKNKFDILNYLAKHQNVNNLYKINNGCDFMIEGVFKHIKDSEEFVENLEEKFKILDKKVYYVIEDIQREKFLSDSILCGVL